MCRSSKCIFGRPIWQMEHWTLLDMASHISLSWLRHTVQHVAGDEYWSSCVLVVISSFRGFPILMYSSIFISVFWLYEIDNLYITATLSISRERRTRAYGLRLYKLWLAAIPIFFLFVIEFYPLSMNIDNFLWNNEIVAMRFQRGH